MRDNINNEKCNIIPIHRLLFTLLSSYKKLHIFTSVLEYVIDYSNFPLKKHNKEETYYANILYELVFDFNRDVF